MVEDTQIMYFLKKERLNLHRSVPTVSILNHLTGWSVQEIIPIILILLFSSYAMKKAIILIGACVAMLVIVAVLVFMIAQDITKSLKKVVAEIEVIAGGNFAHRMQDNMMKRKDDFGQLAGTLETMRESICGLLSQVKIEAANIDTVVEAMDSLSLIHI